MIAIAARTIALAALLTTFGSPAFANTDATEATVFLTNGQTLTAAVDARSDDARLVLRFESDTATLLRRISWSRVAKLRVAGEELSADEAKSRIGELVSTRQPGIERDLATGETVAAAGITFAEIAHHVLFGQSAN